MGVVKHGNSPKKALKEKQAQADVLRSLKDLVSHCLSSPQHPLLHLTGLSILGSATAGAHPSQFQAACRNRQIWK